MLNIDTSSAEMLMKQCTRLIRNKNETKDGRKELRQLLEKLCSHNLGYAIITPRPEYTAGAQQIHFIQRAKRDKALNRNWLINVTFAGYAILYSKGEFFKIIADAYPAALFTTSVSSLTIDNPLICAIDSCNFSLVTTVLSNIHFLEHALNHPEKHLSFLNRCICYAKQAQPDELEILQMLISVSHIRTPLIAALGIDNDDNNAELYFTRQFCSSSTFMQHQDIYPNEHELIIKDCTKCAKYLLKDIHREASKLLKSLLSP